MILKFNEYLEKINEGLIKSYDIDFVIDKASQNLSLLNVNFDLKKLPNNSIKLTLFSFNKIYIDKVFNFLNSIFTNLLGWFPSYMFMKNLSGMKNNMNYDERYLKKNFKYLDEVSIIYESKFDEEVNIPDKLYHLSIQEYQYKILSIGICPKSKNKLSSHGDRIYVCSKCFLYSKTNKDKSTEIFPPLFLKPTDTYILDSGYVHVQCREPNKVSQRLKF